MRTDDRIVDPPFFGAYDVLIDLDRRNKGHLSMAITAQIIGSDEGKMVNGVFVKKAVVTILASGIWTGSINEKDAIIPAIFSDREARGSVRDSGFRLPKEALIAALNLVDEQLNAPSWEDLGEQLTSDRRQDIEERVARIRNVLALTNEIRRDKPSSKILAQSTLGRRSDAPLRRIGFPAG